MILKIFYIWLYKTETIPELVADIEVTNKPFIPIDESEVLTTEDVKRLIETTHKARNKAVIALLFETGARVGELVNIDIKDFINYGRYAEIKLRGKTGERKIAITDSIYYLEQWINEHPQKDQPKAPLFTSYSYKNCGQRITEVGIGQLIKTIGKSINLNKKYNPHWFRHSAADYYARRYHANERELRLRFGWEVNSPMPSRYLHYNEKVANENYLRNKGIEIKDSISKKDLLLEPKICNKCRELFPSEQNRWLHPPTAKYCTCGQVLDKKEIILLEKREKESEKFTDLLLQQPVKNDFLTQGTNEALYQTMLKNPLLLDKFKEIISENI